MQRLVERRTLQAIGSGNRWIAKKKGCYILGRSNSWTDKDDSRLISLWGTLDVNEIASEMGRHRLTILKKAKELNLREGRSRKWESDELEYLKENYKYKNSCKLIAGKLRRSERSIYTMAERLGLKVQWEYKRLDKDGYVEIILGSSKKQKEHRLIYEEWAARKLNSKEHIHHLDQNKQNNHIDNLILVSPRQHNQLHAFIDKNDINSLINFSSELLKQDQYKYNIWLNSLSNVI